ncbi:hypothetical protein [Nostoc sp. 106C]|jgi:hypothetical protein|uniref:hypothetical protein n=1 Tax=Nostoc sp. 106C TaxID=1932667 RepID=UPI000A373ED0|nr:hypothetical protein [Nostoc sp. 106C]OUL19812.1 hypothetical protein BV378_31845 [Nostoc sp. RF31YmG]OUL30916.1 hypothetical protein BV375_13040 [Nostoc sp. 106C]
MSKLLPVVLAAVTILITSTNHPSVTLAGTCASKCGPRPIQFTPGQSIRLEVINRTLGLVKLEKIQGTDPIPLRPGQELQFVQGDETQPNISLVFWDEMGLPLQAIISKPNFGTLHVELRPGKRNPGDRSLHMLTDGHVNVY